MNPEKVLEAPISHEREPHCCGCWIIWRTDTELYAKCNECGEQRDLLALLSTPSAATPRDNRTCLCLSFPNQCPVHATTYRF